MSRLVAILRLDVRLQLRFGFYYAAGFMALVWIAILLQIPAGALPIAVPFIVFTDLSVVGFYFIAGMLLLEKGERTLSAVLVTPLRLGEYLTSKLATLTFLALIITFAVVAASYGPDFDPGLLALGVILTSLLQLLVGVTAVAPYDSISRFMIPSQVYVLLLYLPLIHYFGWWRSPIFYLIPTQGSLLLLKGAFEPVATWQVIYGVFYQLLWAILLVPTARRRFNRHVAARGGL